jgi:hypothetical protein
LTTDPATPPTGRGNDEGEAMAFATYLQEVAAQAGLKVLAVKDDYVKCSFALAEGRNHTVHLFAAGQMGGHNIVRITAPVIELPDGKLDPHTALDLLHENANMKIGSFCLEEIQGHKLLTLHHNMVLETLDPQEFLIIVGALAMTGDKWEQQLGGGDRF